MYINAPPEPRFQSSERTADLGQVKPSLQTNADVRIFAGLLYNMFESVWVLRGACVSAPSPADVTGSRRARFDDALSVQVSSSPCSQSWTNTAMP